MKFSELFPSVSDGIFTVFGSEYATEFEAIFEGIDATDLNRVALALYGNKVVLGYVTAENWEMIIKTMIALHISGWEKAYETLQEEYSAITPVSRTKTKTGTQVDDIDDSNTNLSGNKPFNEDTFKDTERQTQDKSRDATTTYNITEAVTASGPGAIQDSINKELALRMKSLQQQIMRSLVSEITLEVYE